MTPEQIKEIRQHAESIETFCGMLFLTRDNQRTIKQHAQAIKTILNDETPTQETNDNPGQA